MRLRFSEFNYSLMNDLFISQGYLSRFTIFYFKVAKASEKQRQPSIHLINISKQRLSFSFTLALSSFHTRCYCSLGKCTVPFA